MADPAALALTIGVSLLGCLQTFAGDWVKGPRATSDTDDTRLLSFANESLVFDLEERLRFEARSNNRDFDDSINDLNDDSWLLNRFRLGVTVRPATWLKIYGQFQDAREWDSDRPNVPGVQGNEGGDADLRQAYIELGNRKLFPFTLTVGRQPLSYGDRRLLADSVWSNLGRTFDAVKLRFEKERFSVDAFWGRPVQIKEHVFNDSDAADNVGGIYGSTDAIGPQTADLYVLYRDKADIHPDLDPTNTFDPRGSFLGPAQRVTTIGTRVKSKGGALHGWDYGMEVAYQWGEVWSGDRTTPRLDHHAFAAHLEVGYTIEQASWRPRVGVEYNYATGDNDPDDRKSHSFQNLYASNHEKYGYMDEFSWRNLHDARVQMNVRPTKNIDVELNYHAFWLADTNDYWFRANGYSSLRTKTVDGRDVRSLGASNFAGHELDFVVKWKTAKWMNIDVGYSHFFPGNYLKETGPGDDADFGYVQMLLAF
jgi:hypothetical protein